jgi:hypothetical protein
MERVRRRRERCLMRARARAKRCAVCQRQKAYLGKWLDRLRAKATADRVDALMGFEG